VWHGAVMASELGVWSTTVPLSDTNPGEVVHTHVPLFTKQYELVPAKGRRRPAAGKVTAGVAESSGSRRQVCTCVHYLRHSRAARLEAKDQHQSQETTELPAPSTYLFTSVVTEKQ